MSETDPRAGHDPPADDPAAQYGGDLRGLQLNGTYEVEGLIARGGMGEVYRGRVIETGDAVAIKVLRQDMVANEAALALFRKEASALHRLHHDAIIRYFVVAVDPMIRRPYFAMEYVEGEPLSGIVERGPLPLADCLVLIDRVAAGLGAAHQLGIYHRDVSPDNVILPGRDPARAKIIDFGIARSTRFGAETVIGDRFAGKFSYASPEQLGLFGASVGAQSDIYSLGLVIAEAASGRQIDMGVNHAETIERRRSVPSLIHVPAELRPLIARMLEPNPSDRPQSMEAVRALAAVIRTGPVKAASFSLSAAAKPGQAASRPRRMVLAGTFGIAVFALVLAGSTAFLWRSGLFGDRAGFTEPGGDSPPRPSGAGEERRESAPPPPPPQSLPPAAPSPVGSAGPEKESGAIASAQSPPALSAPAPSTPAPSAQAIADALAPRPVQPEPPPARLDPPQAATRPGPPQASPSPDLLSPAPGLPESPPARTDLSSIVPAPSPAPPVPAPSPESFVARFPAMPCLAIDLKTAASRKVEIEAFGNSTEAIVAFDKAFTQALGFESQIQFRQVSEAQCPAVDFLRAHRVAVGAEARITFANYSPRVGETAEGVIRGAGHRTVSALLVGDDGMVRTLPVRSRPDSRDMLVAVTVEPGSVIGRPRLVVVILAPRRPRAATIPGRMPASRVFSDISAELAADHDGIIVLRQFLRVGG